MPKRNKVNDNVGIEKYNDHRMAVESIRLGHVLFDDSIWGNLSGESRVERFHSHVIISTGCCWLFS